MSLFDDYEAEIQFAKDFPFGVPCDTWTSKQGKIKLVDMTENHIKNCMRLVGEDDDWYFVFAKELQRRKPMTNADHIRSMSDEKLAKEAANALSYCAPGIRPSPERCTSEMCVGCWLNWLRTPYKEKEE